MTVFTDAELDGMSIRDSREALLALRATALTAMARFDIGADLVAAVAAAREQRPENPLVLLSTETTHALVYALWDRTALLELVARPLAADEGDEEHASALLADLVNRERNATGGVLPEGYRWALPRLRGLAARYVDCLQRQTFTPLRPYRPSVPE